MEPSGHVDVTSAIAQMQGFVRTVEQRFLGVDNRLTGVDSQLSGVDNRVSEVADRVTQLEAAHSDTRVLHEDIMTTIKSGVASNSQVLQALAAATLPQPAHPRLAIGRASEPGSLPGFHMADAHSGGDMNSEIEREAPGPRKTKTTTTTKKKKTQPQRKSPVPSFQKQPPRPRTSQVSRQARESAPPAPLESERALKRRKKQGQQCVVLGFSLVRQTPTCAAKDNTEAH